MQAALIGYFTIWSVIGVGWLAAHQRVLDESGRRVLSRLAFTVAAPTLLFTLVARADLKHLFSTTLVVSLLAIVSSIVVYLVISIVLFGRRRLADPVIGGLCSAYTNAGNLGLPVAAYVLGDMTWMAPILLIQVGLLQPTALALLDLDAARGTGERLSGWRYVSLPFRNPLTVGTLAGLVVNATGFSIPEFVWTPIAMVGAVAVPAMLIAFGISLRLDPLPGKGPHAPELLLVSVLKVVVQPVIAFALATWVFELPTSAVLAVTVIAALPTAQNIYLIAGRYHVRVLLARDAIFISTIASIPVIIAASTWLR